MLVGWLDDYLFVYSYLAGRWCHVTGPHDVLNQQLTAGVLGKFAKRIDLLLTYSSPDHLFNLLYSFVYCR
jgi:hypothetical protein